MAKLDFYHYLKTLFSISLVAILYCSVFVQSSNQDLEGFTRWLNDHGSKFRCDFVGKSEGNVLKEVEVQADRRIHDGESVFMVPQSLLINSTVVDSSPLGPSLDLVSLTEPIISHEKDLEKQNILHIAQLSLFILYGVHTKDEMWLPYFKLLMMKERNCDVLWMWNDNELEELEDIALMKRVQKWREEIHMLATNIAPKLQAMGVFTSEIQEDDIKNAMCIAQSSSFNITSASGQPVRTLIPGLNFFRMNPTVKSSWWVKDGVLRYRYNKNPIEKGDQVFVNLSPSGDSTQTLFEYGVFVVDGSKFLIHLREPNSRLRRRFMAHLKIRKKMKLTEKFFFRLAGLPYFRVQALSELQIENLMKDVAENQTRLLEVKEAISSYTIHSKNVPDFSCKDEVVALNTMAVHFRDMLSEKSSSISEDEKLITKSTNFNRLSLAIAYRLRFKKLVTNALDMTSASSVETKRECLSQPKDEL
ncbi:uncharacterized protein LOC116294947 [Actinia tenebrosa]|uniref:Uncharacterized protein LOC116294947 n=1 Tax=Actinia tenebrosa TaxID=6105 RepID=A0A6P8I0V0_ACTTE|nr:uncharacterized protein LOC116294947 [Actinia tenebrosa]